jgi:hypothetical protein
VGETIKPQPRASGHPRAAPSPGTEGLAPLEAWTNAGGHERGDPHSAAVSRILAAIGEDSNALSI